MKISFAAITYTLLSGCINQDRDSQKQLYNLLSPATYRLILQEGFNQKEAEEILQKVFINVFNSIESYNSTVSFETWYLQVYEHIVSMAAKEVRNKTNVL